MRLISSVWIVALAWVMPVTMSFVPQQHSTRVLPTRLHSTPEPLATDGEWAAYLDEENTGVVYYFNTRTGESVWEPPTNTFPEVYLKPSKRRQAEAKRAEYYKQTMQNNNDEGKKGFLSKLLEPKEEEEQAEAQTEEPGWMERVLPEKGFKEENGESNGLFAKFLSPPAMPKKVESNEIRVEPEKSFKKPAPAKAAAEEKGVGGLFSQFLGAPPAAEETKAMADTAKQVDAEKKKKAEAARKAAENARPGATINLFGIEFGGPIQETTREQERTNRAEAERKKKAAEARKAAENARPGATINLFGLFADKTTDSPEAAAARREKEAAKKAALVEAKKAKAAATKQAREAQVQEAARIKAEREAAIARSKAEKEEEKRMREMVLKAEAEQKAETERLEKEAKAAEQAAAKAAAAATATEQIYVEEKDTPIKVELGSCVLPHPSKILWGGEDAIFTKGRTFGVFDGVSGADKTDGLPLYSKMLAKEMDSLVGAGTDLSVKDLQDQLLAAAEKADFKATGASTAVIATITDNGFLRAINLGDSRCIVVRDGRVVAQTQEIVHYFDCPYQLSEISPDRPRDARKLNVELVRGDIIMMGSDGVFDNLEDSEIVEIITSTKNAKAAAKQISERSRKVSLNNKAATPYSRQAKKNGDPDFKDGLGGKVDDISCVVAQYV